MTKAKKLLLSCTFALFWILIWEIAARVLDLGFILPTATETAVKLFSLFFDGQFYLTVLASFLRIILGLILGVFLGILLSLTTHYLPVTKLFFSPVITVIRATPVASFIMVLWLVIGSAYVPTVIAVLMVMPIVWQNLDEGFSAIDKELSEVCDVFKIRGKKRLRILVLPTLIKYLIPSIITSAGLSWKSGIAAEIISYTTRSIGQEIYLAKAYFESGEMFAWTAIVIIFSVIIEKILSRLSEAVKL